MFVDSAAFRELEARWLNSCPSLRNDMLKVLNESEARCFKFYKEAQAGMLDQLEGQAEFLQKGHTMFLKHFKAIDERREKKIDELIMQNFDLMVRSSLFCLSIGL